MHVFTTTSFNKDLSRIRDKKLAVRIEKLIQSLESAKSLQQIPSVKKIKGTHNAFRIRMGDYRLGFYLINDSLKLVAFASRKEIYNYFP